MLIRGGTVVDEDGERQADVVVRDGRVAHLAVPGETPEGDTETIDATGLYVLPGLIDPHTHFSLDTGSGRTADDFTTGSGSAAAGGVTSYLNFAIQHPGQGFEEALDAVRREAEGASLVDWSMHLNITHLDDGWERALERVVDGGVSSAKVYTTYKDSVFYVDDYTIHRLMERSGDAGMLVQMHAENDDILAGTRRELVAEGHTSFAYHAAARPAVAESEAVSRGLFFSRVTGSPIYFVHLSSPLSVDLVSEARQRGIAAIAETCPHFLCLDDSVYAGKDAIRYLMTPPIRSEEMRQRPLGAGREGRDPLDRQRPLRLLAGAAGGGRGLHPGEPRHPRRGDHASASLHLRRRGWADRDGRPGPAAGNRPGPDLRPLPAQGPAQRRGGRRPRALRPPGTRNAARRGPPQRRRLLALRRPRAERAGADDDLPGPRRLRPGQGHRRARLGSLHREDTI